MNETQKPQAIILSTFNSKFSLKFMFVFSPLGIKFYLENVREPMHRMTPTQLSELQ